MKITLNGHRISGWKSASAIRDVIEHVNFDEDVDKFTLENVVRDNPYFGVSSSSDRRVESPVVFPGPAGAY